MRFDWDSANLHHISVHNISSVEAEQAVLNASLALDIYIRNGEERTRFIGETSTGKVLIVVVTQRLDATRVVTAFPANRAMRKLYTELKEPNDDKDFGDS